MTVVSICFLLFLKISDSFTGFFISVFLHFYFCVVVVLFTFYLVTNSFPIQVSKIFVYNRNVKGKRAFQIVFCSHGDNWFFFLPRGLPAWGPCPLCLQLHTITSQSWTPSTQQAAPLIFFPLQGNVHRSWMPWTLIASQSQSWRLLMHQRASLLRFTAEVRWEQCRRKQLPTSWKGWAWTQGSWFPAKIHFYLALAGCNQFFFLLLNFFILFLNLILQKKPTYSQEFTALCHCQAINITPGK